MKLNDYIFRFIWELNKETEQKIDRYINTVLKS